MPDSVLSLPALDAARGIRLDLGCGRHKHDLTFGVDKVAHEGVDLVHDLTVTPWPLPDDIAHTVFLIHVWQQIPRDRIFAFMDELWRVTRANAEIFVVTPFGVDWKYLADPAAVNPMGEHTLAAWDSRGDWYQVHQPKATFHLKHWARVAVGRSIEINAVLTPVKEGR